MYMREWWTKVQTYECMTFTQQAMERTRVAGAYRRRHPRTVRRQRTSLVCSRSCWCEWRWRLLLSCACGLAGGWALDEALTHAHAHTHWSVVAGRLLLAVA